MSQVSAPPRRLAPMGGGNGNGDGKAMEFVPFGSKDAIKLSVKIVQEMICTPTKSGKICTEVDAIKFMMLCRARALNPFEGDAYLVGYDAKDGPKFSLITAHQAFLKRAEVHPEYDGMESGLILKDSEGGLTDREGDFFLDGETLLGGWATVYFKNRKHPMRKRLRLAPYNSGYSRWAVDPAGMIVKCAEADALRSSFPTMLGALYLGEELPPPEVFPSRRIESAGEAGHESAPAGEQAGASDAAGTEAAAT